MANISIEKKEGNKTLPWIIAGVVLLAALLWFFMRDGNGVTNASSGSAVADSVAADSGMRSDTSRPR